MPKIWQNLKNVNQSVSNRDPRDASASKNADSEKWENVVERERWILANILQFRSNPLLVLHGSLKCSAAQIKNATNSNSFAPWTLEGTNKPTDHWIWKHWNALKRTVNQELHDIQMPQTLLLPHAKKTFDLLPHHICLNITLKPIRNLYLLFSLRRGHWWISNLSSKISPKPAFSAGFKDRQGQRLHNALRHRVLRLLLLQRGQRGPQTGTCTPPRHADHETKRVCTIVLITFVCQLLISAVHGLMAE